MREKPRLLLLCLPTAILTACSGAAPEDDPSGGTGGGGSGVGGTSSANGGSGANGVGGTGAAGSSGSGPSVTAPEIFGALAGMYEADFSDATAAIVCGSLLPLFDGEETVSGLDCGTAGVHRLEVTEAGLVRFLDTTEAIEFIWDNRSRELPPSDTRLNGGVEYVVGEGVCCIERYVERNLTLMYPSADDLTFSHLRLNVSGNMIQDNGEAAAPLARVE
jgi:hypothetical protein